MKKFLSDSEVNNYIAKAKIGDNAAWEAICTNFYLYIHDRARKRVISFEGSPLYRKDLEEDLYMAGWQGFVSSLKNYEPNKGKFLTYATYYIDGEMSKQLDFILNPLGLTERPKRAGSSNKDKKIIRTSLEHKHGADSSPQSLNERAFDIPEAPDRGKYNAERRALQILEVLKILTDEDHSLSKDELIRMLQLYRIAKYDNGTSLESPNTFTSTLESILAEMDPLEYSEEKESEYRIRYAGYKEDRLKKKINKGKGKKAAEITDFSYVHTFSNAELDKLLQIISFSDILPLDEKAQLTAKLIGTASANYRTPFWDGDKLKFNPKAIHGRFCTRKQDEKSELSENLKTIQLAINNMGQINFRFNRYTADHVMTPKGDYQHVLSPYHLVVYHDNYYCIGLKNDERKIWHYRVDLMSDVEIVRDDEGKIVPIEVYAFEGLPITNASWNPEKYMSEHLNMAYDEPKDIRIKIRDTDYTIIHDWFGDHYEKVDEYSGTDANGNEVFYDVVKIRTSPSMIVHWAMQYGSTVEIMDEEIRTRIKSELEKVGKMYEK